MQLRSPTQLRPRSPTRLLPGSAAGPWGFWGHRRINRQAVYTIPSGPLFGFFKRHIGWVEAHAVDPDKRRYAVPGEAPRHYIDLDRYGPWPHDSLPRDWDSAVARYGDSTLQANGIAPWHIQRMMARLRWAFREGETRNILKQAAELGHYVADLHVPLHCTENYNGQLTGQKGIHGFWESRLPELFGEAYDYWTGGADYIPDVSAVVWQAALESSAAVDSVLSLERELAGAYGDARYAYDRRGERILRVHSQGYAAAYHEVLDGMVERRLRKSIRTVGSLWFTAWVDAGRPALPDGEAEAPNALERLAERWSTGSGAAADSAHGGLPATAPGLSAPHFGLLDSLAAPDTLLVPGAEKARARLHEH